MPDEAKEAEARETGAARIKRKNKGIRILFASALFLVYEKKDSKVEINTWKVKSELSFTFAPPIWPSG